MLTILVSNSLNLVDWNAELDHLDTEQCLQSICDTLVVFCHSNQVENKERKKNQQIFLKTEKVLCVNDVDFVKK